MHYTTSPEKFLLLLLLSISLAWHPSSPPFSITLTEAITVNFEGIKGGGKILYNGLEKQDSISIAISSSPDNISFQLSSEDSSLVEIKVYQRYRTTLAIQDDDGYMELTDWKHFEGNWEQSTWGNDLKIPLKKYTEEDRAMFPSYTEEELLTAVIAHEQAYMSGSITPFSKYLSNPLYNAGHFLWSYISTIDLHFQLIYQNHTCNKFIAIQMMGGC